MAHPVSTTAPSGPDLVKDLTDGAKQLAINESEQPKQQQKKPGNAASQQQQQGQKKEKKSKGAADGQSKRPLEVSEERTAASLAAS